METPFIIILIAILVAFGCIFWKFSETVKYLSVLSKSTSVDEFKDYMYEGEIETNKEDNIKDFDSLTTNEFSDICKK